MEAFDIPATLYVAFGAVIAALLAGFFSFVNLVSAKENKVSEFRLTWVDGLRDEIAEFTSAAQELARINSEKTFAAHEGITPEELRSLKKEFYKETKEAFSRAVENLSKVQLRLNPEDIAKNPDSPEAKLMEALSKARQLTVQGKLNEVLDSCNSVRLAAAPILKNTWTLVKLGEPGYRKIRKYALVTVVLGFYLVLTIGSGLALYSYITHPRTEHFAIPAEIKAPPTDLSKPTINSEKATRNTINK